VSHPEQLGFSFLFKKAHVPQYVPQGATSFSSIHSASGTSRLALLLEVLVWIKLHPNQPTKTGERWGGMPAWLCQIWFIEQFIDKFASSVFWRVVKTHFAGLFF
jgi:hypothetical protein